MKNPNKKMISSSSVSKLKSTIIFILIYLEYNIKMCSTLNLSAPASSSLSPLNQSLSRPPTTSNFGKNQKEHQPHHIIRHSKHSMLKDKHEQRLLNAINLFKLSNITYNSNSKSITSRNHHLHHQQHHRTTSTSAPKSLYYDDLDPDDFGSHRNSYYQKSIAHQRNLKRLYDEDDHDDRTVAPSKAYYQKHQSAWSKYFDRRHETKPLYRPFKRYDYNYNFESPSTTTTRYSLINHKSKQHHYGGIANHKKPVPVIQTKSLHSDSSVDDTNYDYLDEEQDDSDNDERRINRNNKDDELVLSPNYEPGSLTAQKFQLLGTRTAVESAHQDYIKQQRNQHALADAHATKILNEGACKYPKPRLVTINRNPSKSYQPHCTLLHQCGDDTGCCYTLAKTCVVKSSETVKLLFRVTSIGSNKRGEIEELSFTNHTECHCVNRNMGTSPSMIPAQTVESYENTMPTNCTCPSQFEKKRTHNGECECDCSLLNVGCDWIKKGMEHLSLDDRRCIQNECTVPNCEFGNYLRKYGRCPKKNEKMSLA